MAGNQITTQKYAQRRAKIEIPVQYLLREAMSASSLASLAAGAITINGPSSPLFSDLKILKIFDLVKCLNIFFIHKFLNNRLPSDLLDFFEFNQLGAEGDGNQVTRGANMRLLFVPSYNTITFGIKSFSKISITQWNNLQRTYPNINLSSSDFGLVKSLAFSHCLGEY